MANRIARLYENGDNPAAPDRAIMGFSRSAYPTPFEDFAADMAEIGYQVDHVGGMRGVEAGDQVTLPNGSVHNIEEGTVAAFDWRDEPISTPFGSMVSMTMSLSVRRFPRGN